MKRTAVAVFLVLCAHMAGAQAPVSVTPDNMAGWSIDTSNGGTGSLAAHGPAVFERAVPFTAEDGRVLGRGAFYATCSFDAPYNTPSTVWLGLDSWNGQSLAGLPLSRITKLEYYAYVAHIPTATSNPESWESWNQWWTYPKQPIELELTARSPDGTRRRQFWFRPWHIDKARGDNSGRHCKKWLRYDCINFNNPGPYMTGRWYCPDPEQEFASWADLIAVYGDYSLVETSDAPYPAGWKSAGWDASTVPPGSPSCTGTGKCINFEVGARKARTAIFFEPSPIWWFNDMMGFRGYVDYFTLGIDGINVTYDFEPASGDPAPDTVALANKAAYDPVVHRPFVQERYLTRIFGRVTERTNVMLKLDDGSGRPIKLFLYKNIKDYEMVGAHAVGLGEYWAVTGFLERTPFGPADRPLCIWTSVDHMRRLQ